MRYFLVCLVGLIVVAGCGSDRGVVKEPTPLTALSTSALTIDKRWVYHFTVTGHTATGSAHMPVLSDSDVFITDDKGQVRAITIERGRSVWRYDSGGLDLSSGPAYADGLLVVAGSDGDVLALEADSGQLRWRNRVSSEVLAPAMISDGVVIVRSVDGRIVAFNAADGERLWSYQVAVPSLSLHGESRPLIDGDRVYAGFADGRLIALGLHDGHEIWQLAVTVPQGRSELERLSDVDANLALRDGVVYAAAYHGRLVAVDGRNGHLLWARDLSIYRGMAVDNDAVYVVDDDDAVWAVSRHNGATLWKQEALLQRSLTAPVLINGRLVVGDIEGYLHWLDVRDGSFVARTRLGDDGISQLHRGADNALYAVSSVGRLIRLLTHPLVSGIDGELLMSAHSAH